MSEARRRHDDLMHQLGSPRLILGRALLVGRRRAWCRCRTSTTCSPAQVRAELVRRLAELRRVDVDGNAVAELATPTRLARAARGRPRRRCARRRAEASGAAWRRRSWWCGASTRRCRPSRSARCSITTARAITSASASTATRRATLRDGDGAGDPPRARPGARGRLPRTLRGHAQARRAPARGACSSRRSRPSWPAPAHGSYVAALVGAFDVAWAPHKQAQLDARPTEAVKTRAELASAERVVVKIGSPPPGRGHRRRASPRSPPRRKRCAIAASTWSSSPRAPSRSAGAGSATPRSRAPSPGCRPPPPSGRATSSTPSSARSPRTGWPPGRCCSRTTTCATAAAT